MGKLDCGGPVVKEWPNYFLRDDYEIRKNIDDYSREEWTAYSLFRESPYGRIVIITPIKQNFDWVLQEAERQIRMDK